MKLQQLKRLISGVAPMASVSPRGIRHDLLKTLQLAAPFAGLACCLVAATGTAVAQPVEGSISAYSQAYATTGGPPVPVTSTQTENWYTTPVSLSVSTSATASANAGYGRSSGTATMDETATWAPNGTSGTFTSDYTLSSSQEASYVTVGVNNIPFGGNPNDLYDTVGTPANWGFEFTATQSGNFVLNYDVTMTGNLFGLQGFGLFGISGTGGYLDTGDETSSSSGVFVAPVLAGQTYTIGLAEESNYGGSALDTTGSVNADFSWTLPGATSSVPDSASTLTLIGGAFAGLAALHRRLARQGIAGPG
jgi:hypothetical protein